MKLSISATLSTDQYSSALSQFESSPEVLEGILERTCLKETGTRTFFSVKRIANDQEVLSQILEGTYNPTHAIDGPYWTSDFIRYVGNYYGRRIEVMKHHDENLHLRPQWITAYFDFDETVPAEALQFCIFLLDCQIVEVSIHTNDPVFGKQCGWDGSTASFPVETLMQAIRSNQGSG